MSHWTKVEATVDDLAVLKSACEELGAECILGGIARGWTRAGQMSAYGQDQKCDMVIKIPNGRYDIAVKKGVDGVYSLEGDYYDGSLERFFGKDGHKLGKIFEMYSVHRAENICRKKRKKWKRVVQETHIDLEVYV
jgi:hypothetical protein